MWHVTDTDNFYQSAFGQHISGLLSREIELCDREWMAPAASLIRLESLAEGDWELTLLLHTVFGTLEILCLRQANPQPLLHNASQ